MNINRLRLQSLFSILLCCFLSLTHTFVLCSQLPQDAQPITEEEYEILLNNLNVDYAYIPQEIKSALKYMCATHPEWQTIIPFDTRASSDHAIAPYADTRKAFQLLALFIATHEHEIPKEIITTINEYTQDLTNGNGRVIIEYYADNTTRNACHAKIYCNLSVRNTLSTRWLKVCGDAVICGDLTVNGIIHGTVAGGTPETTFITENGNAVTAGHILNVIGNPNIITSGAGNTLTIGVDGTTNNAVQVGNAGGSLTSLPLGTDGQVVIGATGATPLFATITSVGGSVQILGGPNSLNLEATGTLSPSAIITENGTAMSLAGVFTFSGTPNIVISASGNNVTFGVDGTTDHAVQIGNAAGALTSIPVGTNGQVVIGATGADPAFALLTSNNGTVSFTTGANSLDLAVTNTISSIIIITENGTATSLAGVFTFTGTPNIKTSGSGNTVTFGVDGTTDHAVQIGNAAGALTSIPVGTNGQVVIGATGADPAFATLTSSNGTITFTPGVNTLDLVTSTTISTITIITENGTATSIDGVFTFTGTPNIKTSGSGNTVTFGVDGTTDHAVQIGNAAGALTSIPVGTNGQVIIGATGADPAFALLTSSNGSISFTTGPNSLDLRATNTMNFGNTVRVDAVFGNDATGQRNGAPFLTITAALAAAAAGDMVWIFPGTYAESFTIPTSVSVIGTSRTGVNIATAPGVATDLVTMGNSSSISNVTLSLSSASAVTLKGIVFPGTTTATASVRNVTLTVNNTNAGAATTYGIHSNGTGTPSENTPNVELSTIMVTAAGTGSTRGILVDTSANNLNIRESTITASTTGAGSAIGAETNFAGTQLSIKSSSISGGTADISQTLGTIILEATDLLNSNANTLGFTARTVQSSIIWADPGTLPAGTNFMKVGTATPSALASEQFIYCPQTCLAKSLSVQVNTTAAGTDTFTLRKNAVDTALVVSITSPATSAINNATTVSFAAGDRISMKCVGAGAGPTETAVMVELY